MQFLVILFFFGLSAGIIGKLKGSSFVLWFLVGFCLPVFGTIAALMSRWESKELRRECENCGQVLALHDQVCSACGYDLDFPEEAIVSREMERQLRDGGQPADDD